MAVFLVDLTAFLFSGSSLGIANSDGSGLTKRFDSSDRLDFGSNFIKPGSSLILC